MIIGYIRVSTDLQENSVITQKETIQNYSKLQGLEVDEFFVDFGISGKDTIKRESYLRLMEMVKKGKVNTIITTSLSRWSRNTLDLLNSVDTLKKHNTDLMVIKENIPSLKTPMGQFFITILGSVYTLERNLTSERTKDVIQNKKRNGKVYGRVCYGYDNINGELVENKSELKVLRKIKRLRTKGNSYKSITEFLNRNNYKQKNGKKFTKGNLHSILKTDREIIKSSSVNC